MRVLASQIVIAVAFTACATSREPSHIISSADPHHVVLLSWKPLGQQQWQFAVLRGDSRLVGLTIDQLAEYVSHSPPKIVGFASLERELRRYAHQPETAIYWRDYPGYFEVPDDPLPDRVLSFARSHDIRLELDPVIQD